MEQEEEPKIGARFVVVVNPEVEDDSLGSCPEVEVDSAVSVIAVTSFERCRDSVYYWTLEWTRRRESALK